MCVHAFPGRQRIQATRVHCFECALWKCTMLTDSCPKNSVHETFHKSPNTWSECLCELKTLQSNFHSGSECVSSFTRNGPQETLSSYSVSGAALSLEFLKEYGDVLLCYRKTVVRLHKRQIPWTGCPHCPTWTKLSVWLNGDLRGFLIEFPVRDWHKRTCMVRLMLCLAKWSCPKVRFWINPRMLRLGKWNIKKPAPACDPCWG